MTPRVTKGAVYAELHPRAKELLTERALKRAALLGIGYAEALDQLLQRVVTTTVRTGVQH